jgi:PAS domain S-box-containing protein
MDKPDLHILMLEDEPMDAELNIAQLQLIEEYNCIVQLVSTKEAYLQALQSKCPDIILSDYNIVQYNGLEALRDLRSINPLIPFIFVTGAINEETAVGTIKEGAWDYVVKDRLYRLPIAIRSALQLREEKINTAKAKTQTQKLLMAIEQGPAQIVINNIEGIIEYVNARFTEVTGYQSDETIGKDIRLFFPIHTFDEVWKKLSEGISWHGEIQNTRKDGTCFWEYITISPIKDKDNQITHFVAVKEDITKRKLMEHELIEARDRAEQSDKLKDAFLKNLSHEIRTPLNAIVGFSGLLQKDKALPWDTIESYTSIIKSSSNQLLSIVSDVLTISSIQTGQEITHFKQVNINTMFDDLYSFFNLRAVEKNLNLNFYKEAPDKLLATFTDETKLMQILANLLNNAIKFTHTGSIEMKYALKVDTIEFSVKDTGIGIHKKAQGFIFERFRQADTSIAAKYGGTGLGLAISRSFAQMIGGNIRVESTPGKGSTFYLTIPYSLHEAQFVNEDLKLPDLWNKSLTILVAEDEVNNYKFLKAVLLSKNVTLLYAANGEEAVTMCQQNPDIEVILMDIKMPVMDGITALKKIRKFRKNIPVIAQTAYVLEHDKQYFLDMGFTDYIVKPIAKEELFGIINKAIKQY